MKSVQNTITPPLVSIGIPTYNRPKGLRETLVQFTSQTYQNLEIIVSDNCSENKDVEKVVEEFSAKDKRITYIKQSSNIGMFANFQFVLDKANGEYFIWASDDDLFYNNFVEECLRVHQNNPDIILCSPLCRVYRDDKEIMKYKPDFMTLGLSKMERIRKIAFYIKKSHSALYGLYKTEVLKQIKLKAYLDCDGLLLLELSKYGSFYKLDKVLLTSFEGDNNEESKSLTNSKKKFIKTYKMWPSYFLIKYERITLFFFFLFSSLKWDRLSLIEHIKILGIIYHSFFGYNTFFLFNKIRNLKLYLKKRRIIAQYNLGSYDKEFEHSIQAIINDVDRILVTINDTRWDDDNSVILREDMELMINKLKEKYPNKLFVYRGYWLNKHAQMQYGLDYIKSKSPEMTHCLLMDSDLVFQPNQLNQLIESINTYKYFNRAIKTNCKYLNRIKYEKKSDSQFLLTLFPIRNYISFKNSKEVTAGTLVLE